MSEYQVIDRTDSRQLAEFLAKEGQLLLPMVELVEQAQIAIDEVIDVSVAQSLRQCYNSQLSRLPGQNIRARRPDLFAGMVANAVKSPYLSRKLDRGRHCLGQF